jgi:hypothetical protein
MFTEKTVLILGAGASAPYDFPSGEGLVKDIVNGLRSGSGMFKCVRECFSDYKDFADSLVLSGTTSVDAFLEKKENEKFLKLGKFSIAAALLPKENEYSLFKDKGPGWYRQLFALLTEGCSFDDFSKNDLSIVTFNYDRSLECYLKTALCNLYGGRNPEEYKEKLRAIKIIHVHGKLGYLPWETPDEQLDDETLRRPILYGYKNRSATETDRLFEERGLLTTAAGNIQIISEDIDETDKLKQAVRLLQESSKVFILGFGFHPTNLRRLKLTLFKGYQLKCTTYKLTADRYKLLDKYCGITSMIDSNLPYLSTFGWFDGTIDEFIQKVGLT